MSYLRKFLSLSLSLVGPVRNYRQIMFSCPTTRNLWGQSYSRGKTPPLAQPFEMETFLLNEGNAKIKSTFLENPWWLTKTNSFPVLNCFVVAVSLTQAIPANVGNANSFSECPGGTARSIEKWWVHESNLGPLSRWPRQPRDLGLVL